MNVIKKFLLNDNYLIICLLFLILINYFSLFFPIYSYLKNLYSYLILIFFLILVLNINTNNYLIKFYILFLIIVSLGSPTFHYDARWIWLFKAKQIFFNENLNFLNEEYFIDKVWQSYPLLGPSLGTIMPNVFNYWNEVMPKFFTIILSVPSLIFLNSLIKENFNKILFIVLLFLILEKSLIIGEMDGILALYFVSSVVMILNLFLKKKIYTSSVFNLNYFLFFLFIAIMTLLKKESFALLLICLFSIIISLFIFNNLHLSFKKFLIVTISICPLFFWELYLLKNDIFSLQNPIIKNLFSQSFFNFLKNFFSFEKIFIINKEVLTNKSIFLSLLIFSFTVGLSTKDKNNKIINILIFNIFIIFLSYLGFYSLVYLSTSYELLWHLNVSASRIILPLSLLLGYFSILIYQELGDEKYI